MLDQEVYGFGTAGSRNCMYIVQLTTTFLYQYKETFLLPRRLTLPLPPTPQPTWADITTCPPPHFNSPFLSALSRHCTENSKPIFPEMKLTTIYERGNLK
jgi:hypothetical protein